MAASRSAPRARRLLPALGAAALLAGCNDETVIRPPAPTVPAAGALFQSYVAIGNSITAGFQSGGINDSTQQQSYAVLLARQMGTTFNIPSLAAPGCPPPFTNIFTQTRLSPVPCALRTRPLPDILHNVSVPGAAVIDPLSNLLPDSDPNTLTTLFLGGRTQLEAAARARPTFMTVFIGNNDVLGTITRTDTLAGDPSTITSVADFADRVDDLVDAIDALGPQGGVIIGVVQVGLAPYLTQGRAYFAAQAAVPTLTVDNNCLAFQVVPGTTDTVWVSVPFHYGAPLFGQAAAGVPTTLDCSVGEVLSVAELLNLGATVAQYNGILAAAAQDLGFVFVDPNQLLLQLAAAGGIRPFPAFDPTDPQHETAPFGTALSRDGIHPSASTHKTFANALIQVINGAYGSSIPAIP